MRATRCTIFPLDAVTVSPSSGSANGSVPMGTFPLAFSTIFEELSSDTMIVAESAELRVGFEKVLLSVAHAFKIRQDPEEKALFFPFGFR